MLKLTNSNNNDVEQKKMLFMRSHCTYTHTMESMHYACTLNIFVCTWSYAGIYSYFFIYMCIYMNNMNNIKYEVMTYTWSHNRMLLCMIDFCQLIHNFSGFVGLPKLVRVCLHGKMNSKLEIQRSSFLWLLSSSI